MSIAVRGYMVFGTDWFPVLVRENHIVLKDDIKAFGNLASGLLISFREPRAPNMKSALCMLSQRWRFL
jgi:hypothetical protein